MLIAAAFTGTVLNGEPHPANIGVRMILEADTFELLDGKVETSIAEQLASKLAKKFGFLEWRPLEPEAPKGDIEWVLELVQEPEPITWKGKTFPGSKISLRHYGVLGKSRFELEQNPQETLLYGPGDVKPAQNPEKLKTRLLEQLDAQLSDDFRENASESLLSKITIADQLIVDAKNELLIIPIQLEDIKAKTDSSLGVRFKTNNGVDAYVVMTPLLAKVSDGDQQGCVGMVSELKVPPIDDIELPQWWDDRFPEIFNPAHTVFEVYMHDYSRDPTAGAADDSGTAVDP